jgi:predicted  nucleic acid-binding Zn-ribbon protein
VTTLEPLLALQERDLALDRLRHRRDSLPERAELAAVDALTTALQTRVGELRTELAEVARDEQRLDDEALSLRTQAESAEQKLYSGEVTSPRELQALQADVDQLRRHQRSVEDRELAAMERRQPIEEALAGVEGELAAASTHASELRAALTEQEAAIDAEAAVERQARAGVAAGVDDGLLGDYERTRAKANGVGAARLVGHTCQGCHLTIPATEVDRIRRGTGDGIAHCDNCGCILVP